MVTTVELSMYPFQENYRDLIREFLTQLRTHTELQIDTGPTSTVIVGDHVQVMDCLTELMEWSHQEQGRSVFVAKVLPGYDGA